VRLRGRREGVERVPDRRTGEAVDHLETELRGGMAGADHLLGGALSDALGLAVAPDVVGQYGLVPFVDGVADRLPDEVIRDREEFEAVFGQQRLASLGVTGLVEEAAHV